MTIIEKVNNTDRQMNKTIKKFFFLIYLFFKGIGTTSDMILSVY